MRMFCLTKTIAGLSRSIPSALAMGIFLNPALSMQAMADAEAPQPQTDLTSLSIEELLSVEVYSASKFVQKTTEAPAAVTIITADDIKRYGYRTLADILRSARGLFVSYDRDYQYVGVRGFNRPGDYNSRILLLVDGYRVNDTVYDTASIGQEFFLDTDLIERVEIVRGPGSSIYGSNAFFGVVNVITKHPEDFNGWEVSGEAGSFNTGKARLTYGKQYGNGAEMLVSATYSDSGGQDLFFPEYDTPANNNGIARHLDYDRAKRVYGKFGYGGFTLAAAYSERTKGVPTAAFSTVFNDPRTRTVDSQAMLDLGYYNRLDSRQELTARVYYGSYFYDGTLPYDQPPVTVNKDKSWAEWRGVEAKWAGRYDRHRLVAGIEYQDNYRQDQKNYDLDPAAVYLDDKRSSERQALYVQDEITLRQGLLLNAGVRYDHYSTVGETVNPRLALIVSPREETAFKLLYGTAFRAPNAYELYYANGIDSKASPNLKPEKITTYEAIAEHEIEHNFRLTASAYYNEISDLINHVTDPADGLLMFQNIGQVKAKGAEFEAERAWADDTRLRASYAWQMTRNQITGLELENSPRHLVKFNYSAPLSGNALRAGLELQYTGKRRTQGGNSTGGFVTANATLLSQKLAKGLELSASVYNLFDRKYADPARPEQLPLDVIQQDGRSFRFKLSYRF